MRIEQRRWTESGGCAVEPGAGAVGFCAHGEIAPFRVRAACALPNQTMTIAMFAER